MSTKRTPIRRGASVVFDPAFRAKIVRLLELRIAHAEAISGRDRSFYDDGRHDEKLTLAEEIYPALGIRPWHDAGAMLREALGRAERETKRDR